VGTNLEKELRVYSTTVRSVHHEERLHFVLQLEDAVGAYFCTSFTVRKGTVKYRVITKEMTEMKHVLLSHG
jgi:hypothetical protein